MKSTKAYLMEALEDMNSSSSPLSRRTRLPLRGRSLSESRGRFNRSLMERRNLRGKFLREEDDASEDDVEVKEKEVEEVETPADCVCMSIKALKKFVKLAQENPDKKDLDELVVKAVVDKGEVQCCISLDDDDFVEDLEDDLD